MICFSERWNLKANRGFLCFVHEYPLSAYRGAGKRSEIIGNGNRTLSTWQVQITGDGVQKGSQAGPRYFVVFSMHPAI